MIYPNETEILVFDLFDGTLLKRLRAPSSLSVAQARGAMGQRNIKSRTTALAWRGAGNLELYSSHLDGSIRVWIPKTKEQEEIEEEELKEASAVEDADASRKRKALDDVFQSLTKKQVTFT